MYVNKKGPCGGVCLNDDTVYSALKDIDRIQVFYLTVKVSSAPPHFSSL